MGAAQVVGDQGGLAEASLGDDVDDPLACPGTEPVEQPVAGQRLGAEDRALDFAAAQREASLRQSDVGDETIAAVGLDGHPKLLHPQPPIPGRRGEG